MGKTIYWNCCWRELMAILAGEPGFIIADYPILQNGFLSFPRRGVGMAAVALTAVALITKLVGRATKAEFGATNIQRTCFARRISIFSTLSLCVTVGRTVRTAVWVAITASTYFCSIKRSTACTVGAWLVFGTGAPITCTMRQERDIDEEVD
jgi:hypothetical protein